MLYCTKCQKIFDENDLQRHGMSHGFNDGYYEYYKDCPYCGGDEFEEAHKCENCGAYFFDEENDLKRLCPGCVEKNLNFETLFKATQKNGQKEAVEINILLAEFFTPSEIEVILRDFISNTPFVSKEKENCREFFKSDVDYAENVLADCLKESKK